MEKLLLLTSDEVARDRTEFCRSRFPLGRDVTRVMAVLALELSVCACSFGPRLTGQFESVRSIRQIEFSELTQLGAEELARQCKYESGIVTQPPPGVVALTFDDGPDPMQTPAVLGLLDQYGIRATFFAIGQKAQRSPDLIHEIESRGHLLIGNHSWSHPNFHKLTVSEQEVEVREADVLVSSIGGAKFFRYPYGNSSCETNQLLHSLGYKIVGWHVDSCDWAFNENGSVASPDAEICGVSPQHRSDYVGHVVSAVARRNGGILLLHENQPNTMRQLGEIVQKLIAAGFQFGSIDEGRFNPSLH